MTSKNSKIGLFESRLTLTQDEKLTEVLIFLVKKKILLMFCVVRGFFKFKTKRQATQTENLTEQLQTEIKILAYPGLA